MICRRPASHRMPLSMVFGGKNPRLSIFPKRKCSIGGSGGNCCWIDSYGVLAACGKSCPEDVGALPFFELFCDLSSPVNRITDRRLSHSKTFGQIGETKIQIVHCQIAQRASGFRLSTTASFGINQLSLNTVLFNHLLFNFSKLCPVWFGVVVAV